MQEVIRTLLYFDVFSYPLTAEELIEFAGIPDDQRQDMEEKLQVLVHKGLIREHAGYFFVGEDKETVRRRIDGNLRASARLKTARRYTKIMAAFPFVQGVFISGSLSKGFAAPDDDIDYFIVTNPRRLWLTRSLLTLFKKIFLINSHRNFCINYFVDTNHLAIRQQNRFTATELAFLLPTYNSQVHQNILHKNGWIRKYYPVFSQNGAHVTNKVPIIKKWAERLLNNGLGDALELKLFRLSRRIIRKKYRHLNDAQFASCFSIEPHEIKYLPNRQQYRIMKAYYRNLARFELQSGLELINGTGKYETINGQNIQHRQTSNKPDPTPAASNIKP